jgi:hypothetical protein
MYAAAEQDLDGPIVFPLALSKYTIPVIGLPVSVIEGDAAFVYSDAAGESWTTEVDADGTVMEISVGAMDGSIFKVSYVYSEDGYDAASANVDVTVARVLQQTLGEPVEVTIDGEEGSVEDVIAKLGKGPASAHYIMEWNVEEDGVSCSYLYQNIITGNEDAGIMLSLDSFTVF